MRSVIVLFVLLLNSTIAVGHPGHGTTDPSSFHHYMTSPLHVGMAVIVLTLIAASCRMFLTPVLTKSQTQTPSLTQQ